MKNMMPISTELPSYGAPTPYPDKGTPEKDYPTVHLRFEGQDPKIPCCGEITFEFTRKEVSLRDKGGKPCTEYTLALTSIEEVEGSEPTGASKAVSVEDVLDALRAEVEGAAEED